MTVLEHSNRRTRKGKECYGERWRKDQCSMIAVFRKNRVNRRASERKYWTQKGSRRGEGRISVKNNKFCGEKENVWMWRKTCKFHWLKKTFCSYVLLSEVYLLQLDHWDDSQCERDWKYVKCADWSKKTFATYFTVKVAPTETWPPRRRPVRAWREICGVFDLIREFQHTFYRSCSSRNLNTLTTTSVKEGENMWGRLIKWDTFDIS